MIEISKKEAKKHGKIIKTNHGGMCAVIDGVCFRVVEDKPEEAIGNDPTSSAEPALESDPAGAA